MAASSGSRVGDTVPRILKIAKIEGTVVHCLFNTGEYRKIDLAAFASTYDLRENVDMRVLLTEGALSSCKVANGTLTFPSLKKVIELSSGKRFEVEYDLDPIMLYEVSETDKDFAENYQIGRLLKKARKKAGLTQAELADRAGTTKSYISRIENNRTDIALKTLRRIVEVGLDKRLAIID